MSRRRRGRITVQHQPTGAARGMMRLMGVVHAVFGFVFAAAAVTAIIRPSFSASSHIVSPKKSENDRALSFTAPVSTSKPDTPWNASGFSSFTAFRNLCQKA